jgi:hypothetical protein
MTMLAAHLLESGQLRDDIELDEVRDILWTYIAVELYELLVMNRTWPLDRYASWITHAITTAICPWVLHIGPVLARMPCEDCRHD